MTLSLKVIRYHAIATTPIAPALAVHGVHDRLLSRPR
jgi:hypothetical protein